jgi:hypothetical protein
MKTQKTRVFHVLGGEKQGETYLFIFPPERANDAIRAVGRMASNPELSLTWYDAAIIAQAINERVGAA